MSPAIQDLPAHLLTLADHEAHAQGVLDANAWAYFSGGAGDEITLRSNVNAWAQLRLLPRVLQDLSALRTQVQLLGRTLAHPLIVAPMAYQRLAHPDGELGMAHAAAAQGAGLVLSTQASLPLEQVATAFQAYPERGPLWFQLYLQPDRAVTLDLARRAEAAGYEALVVTVDAPAHGVRDRERRAGFHLPPGIAAINLQPYGPQPSSLQQAPTWVDLDWLASQTGLPIILKGVLHPLDAQQAVDHGAAALVVSNHGGRVLDTAAATASVLPAMVLAVGGRAPVLVDGGLRRGTDVLKALALGATAVLVGRPCLWGLANAGAVGVAHVLRVLRDEFEVAMALCGCTDANAIPADRVMPRIVIANATDSHL